MQQEDAMKKPAYKPRWYRAEVLFEDVAGTVAAESIANGSVTIQNADFILRKITAENVGPSNIDFTVPSLANLVYHDHLPMGYTFSMRSDSHVYMSDQVPLIATLGSAEDFQDCPSPVRLLPKSTITFDVVTIFPRTDTTKLVFVLHGFERAEAYPERL